MTIGQRNWNTPTTILYPGGSTRSQSLDGFQRLTELRVKDPGQTDLMRYRYAFDAENNILRKDTEHGRYDYRYDSLYRLTAADNPVVLPDEAYGYDPLGNRLSDRRKPDPAQTGERWQYNADNQLTESATENSALSGSNSLPVTHDYDANGSLIRKRTPAGTEAGHPYDNQRFVYDAQNRLTEVQDPAGHPIASYQYDPQGRRIRKTVHRAWNGGAWESLAEARTATYVYGEEGLVAEYQTQGNNTPQLMTQYGWEPQGEWGVHPVWIKTKQVGNSAVEYFYFQNDHLGSPQKIIDGSGQIVWSQNNAAFGESMVDPASRVINNLRFPGQYEDSETDMRDNYFRTYDPGIGRYIQNDPIGLSGGINIYAYSQLNPTNKIDPLGQFPISGPENFPDTPNLSICEYYNRTAKNNDCNYHNYAYQVCRDDNTPWSTVANELAKGCSKFSKSKASTNQILNCIRTCLVASDNFSRNNLEECKINKNCGKTCTKRQCIDEYHYYCFRRCGLSPGCYGGNFDDSMPGTWFYDD